MVPASFVGRGRLYALAAASILTLGFAPAQAPVPEPADLDPGRLEVVEDLSESLANDLLGLSVATRNRDLTEIAAYFPERLTAAPLPTEPGPVEPELEWIGNRSWTSPGGERESAERTREELVREWATLLEHFSEIDDARFKVKGAQFDDSARSVEGAPEPTAVPGATGSARIAFFVVGRSQDGEREWLRGRAAVSVRKPEEGVWQFTSFETTEMRSMVASVDIFSEVADPAGVGATLPPYGTPENGGFVWRGAAAADIDGDGWLDLFVTSVRRNYLFVNTGDGRFRDATDEAGLGFLASGTAPLLLDYDNDGDTDVFLSAVGQQVLLENRLVPDGRLWLEDVSFEAGVAVSAIGFSAAAADVNDDGQLDIYVVSYNRYGQITPDVWYQATNGTPNLFFVSQPDGTYREQARQWGVDDRRWSYAATFFDVDDDGRQDLYVVNDFGENAFYVHKGDRFEDEARARGVLDPGNGMGVAVGDWNRDGLLDLHVTNMSSTAGNRILSRLFPGSSPQDNVLKKLASGNHLYENVGGGRFRDVTADVGGFSGGWAWGGGFLDFDNDGREDLYTPNGFISGKSMKDT
jgi:hypothetical protein